MISELFYSYTDIISLEVNTDIKIVILTTRDKWQQKRKRDWKDDNFFFFHIRCILLLPTHKKMMFFFSLWRLNIIFLREIECRNVFNMKPQGF